MADCLYHGQSSPGPCPRCGPQQGWPTHCPVCGRFIRVDEDGDVEHVDFSSFLSRLVPIRTSCSVTSTKKLLAAS